MTDRVILQIKGFLDRGNSVVIMLGEGGESKFNTNINYLLEDYGMFVNPDCAVRTVYFKYLHPERGACHQRDLESRAFAGSAKSLLQQGKCRQRPWNDDGGVSDEQHDWR